MNYLRIIGDVHGRHKDYIQVAKQAEYSVQVGDLGFQYNLEEKHLDHTRHVFIGGNHDNYDIYHDTKHALGDYGEESLGDISFFFIRGGFSIDHLARKQHYRITGQKSWWEEEQLTLKQGDAALDAYIKAKPTIMLSHSCPQDVARIIGNPSVLKAFGYDPHKFRTNTQMLLQSCFEQHQPELWVFGHFHLDREVDLNGTKFICLPELKYLDINKDGSYRHFHNTGKINL